MNQQATRQVDVQAVIDELKAQRNTLADQLSVAGAVISTVEKENNELKKRIEELTNGGTDTEGNGGDGDRHTGAS